MLVFNRKGAGDFVVADRNAGVGDRNFKISAARFFASENGQILADSAQ